jgi:hypothetical protein
MCSCSSIINGIVVQEGNCSCTKQQLNHLNMLKITYTFIIGLLLLPLVGKSQSKPNMADFTAYVSKKYIVSNELKANCEWMYAIVRVRTDANNKIINYDFVNEPAECVKKGFNGLIGYQFPKTMKINKHPIVFYFSIDNTETCIPKEGEMRFYAPNHVVNIIITHLQKILKDDPKTIFIPNLIYKVIYATQR